MQLGEETPMTNASKQRVKAFFDEFIRSEYVANWTAEKDGDFINEPERAARCYDAAEFGCDGKTHAEVIEDWREAFENMVKYCLKANGKRHWEYPSRLSAGVNALIDECESWHEKNGSLFQQIG